MGFDVAADAYQRFMGRYSDPLAHRFVDFAGLTVGDRALDVGCGPGALTERLAGLLGSPSVTAVDPSPTFVRAVSARCPDVDVETGFAEELPFPDGSFDVTLAQLAVHFFRDPVAGVREMVRVTRPGGTIAANVWDHGGGRGPVSAFWAAAAEFDPDAPNESALAGVGPGSLAVIFRSAGLEDVTEDELTVTVDYLDIDDWWQPYTEGVGPAGDYVSRLSTDQRERLRAICGRHLPRPPFSVDATAWAVRASRRSTIKID